MKKILLTLINLSILTLSFAGGGWIHQKGKGYFQVGQQFLTSNKLFNLDGEKEDIATTGTYTSSFYGELGLGKNLEIDLFLPFLVRNTVNHQIEKTLGDTILTGKATNFIGDPTIALKYGIIQNKPVVLSASLTLGIPLGTLDEESSIPLPTGDKELNQILTLEAGYSIRDFYFILGAGFNNRVKGFSDDVRFHGEAGYKKGKFLGSLKIFSVNALKNGDNSGNANGLFSNNISYFSYGPQIAFYPTEKLGVLANMLTGTGGTNVLAAPSYTVGIFLDLK